MLDTAKQNIQYVYIYIYILVSWNVTTSQLMAGIYLYFQKMLEEKEKACAPIGIPDFWAFLKGIKKYSVHLMPIGFQNIQRDESIENDNSATKGKKEIITFENS